MDQLAQLVPDSLIFVGKSEKAISVCACTWIEHRLISEGRLLNSTKIVSIQNSAQIDPLENKLKDMGLSSDDMPEITAGPEGIVAVATFPNCEAL